MLLHLLPRKIVRIKSSTGCRTLTCALIVEYADLPIIDISKADTEEGRAALATEVREALHRHGFFYIVNHGYSETQVRPSSHHHHVIACLISMQTARMFDIADVPFSAVSDSEKQIYAGTMKQTGSYQGYKLRQYWVRDGCISLNTRPFDLRNSIKFSISMLGSATSLSIITVSGMHSIFTDSSHILSVNRDVTKRGHPEALRPLLPEIKEFGKHNHFNVLHPILRQTYMLLLEDDPSDDNFFQAYCKKPRATRRHVSQQPWLRRYWRDMGYVILN